MNKILIVAQREFLTRVKKKTFLLTTILLPVLIFGFYAMIIYFSIQSSDGLKIAIADNGNVFNKKIETKNDELNFVFVDAKDETTLKKDLKEKQYDAYLWVPADATIMTADKMKIISNKTIGMMTQERIKRSVDNTLEKNRLLSLNLTQSQLDSIQHKGDIDFLSVEAETGTEKQSVAGISYAVGIISGFLIYFVLFIYGTMVMRGVMEEKMNRIAEVIVSSVKPFQLMMGKIFGIGAVGLVQFIIWGILIIGLQFLLPVIFPGMAEQMTAQSVNTPGAAGAVASSAKSGALATVMNGLDQLPLGLIFGCFIFYFLGGYLLYSSLFAAVGSAVNEDPQDAQSLLFPIMMPIVFSMAIMMKAANDPTSGLAVFGSLFPLTSPVVMMGRIAYGTGTVPIWQLAASFAFLILGFIFTTWIAAKIYRTGILMYGKKPTWKEMAKWAFRKG
jgi:ABC-2 type transport system permease protein